MSWFSQVFGTPSSASGLNSGPDNVPVLPQGGDIRWAARAGDRLAGHYLVKRPLGQGGFGQVYLCFYDVEFRECAVKILRPDRRYEPKNLTLLREEARRWVRLGVHANVIAAFNLEEHARLPCIVMEYMPGAQSLKDITAQGIALPWKAALSVAGQVACGLDYAWQTARMVHRDITPGNILVSAEAPAKVTDFGLSLAGPGGDASAFAGTPHYMAPELFGEAPADTRSDAYSFGITIYQSMTGRWPYGEMPKALDEVARRHLTAQAIDPAHFVPDIPLDFRELVMSCLAKQPEARPQNFHDLLAALDVIARRELGGSIADIAPSITIGELDRLVNLSSMHDRLGEGVEAKDFAERALRLDPDSVKAWLALGNAARTLGDLTRAKLCFERALASGPDEDNERRILGNLALTSYELGDETAGRQWLLRAIEAAEAAGAIGALDNLTGCFPKVMTPARAIALCDRVIAANPDSAVTWNNRAIICRQNGQYADAKRSAQKALELNSLYAKAWTNLANAHMLLGEYDQCRQAAERSVEIDPMTAGAYPALAVALWELGDPDGARRTMADALMLFPGNAQIRQAAQSFQR